jgi:predicted DNA-binding transcriptional regulator AlpA
MQVPARVACRLAGVSLATWWRLLARGKVPPPVRLGGRVLWRVEELEEWVRHGCPDARTWSAMQNARANGGGGHS